MKTKKFLIRLGRRFLVALAFCGVVGGYLLFEKVNLTLAQDCLATIDSFTGEQTDPACPYPQSEEASVTAVIANLHKLDPSCPPPTVQKGHQCVLQEDVAPNPSNPNGGLKETLELASNTKLNCQGHRLSPTSLGSGVTRSQPEVGILLNDVQNVRIQNCVLDGFDFGIFGMRNKVSQEVKDDPGGLARLRNKILSNTINARFFGIQMFNVDNTEIKDNTITFTSPGGVGVVVTRDSDLNQIKNNSITGNFFPPLVAARLAPGPSNPLIRATGGLNLFVGQIGALDQIPTLVNVIIEDTLYQIDVPFTDRSEDNVVEGNILTANFEGSVPPIQGMATSQAIRTVIRGNTIVRGSTGITLNGFVGTKGARFPGTCTLDSSRLCLTNTDCNIAGIDQASKGTCAGAEPKVPIWPGEDYIVADNTITDTSSQGISVISANNPILTGNLISTTFGAGIALAGAPALGTTTLTGNIVSGAPDALFLNRAQGQTTASFFGAKISLNNFTGYTTAVRTSNDYTLPSELSVDGRGNYWDLTCVEGGFDSNKVLRLNGTVNPNVVDSHPYGVPVAETPDENVPLTCF